MKTAIISAAGALGASPVIAIGYAETIPAVYPVGIAAGALCMALAAAGIAASGYCAKRRG